ncbi:Leucine-rich repeat protein [Nymphaea thermarum]|nr:Leucine-rich repeat protein [Nymphaea thermarum]
MSCSSLAIISDVSNLKALGVLNLDRCAKLIDVHGLEKLRSLEDLTLDNCSNLSDALRDRLKDAEFEYLSRFTISGIMDLHQCNDQGLSFVLPKIAEVFIPIFSKGYAESRSCLDEMAKMVKCKKLMLPVFYDVEPREHLTATPDFSSTPHIVKLILDGCILLAQVHESIGCLKTLIYVSMRGCYQLKELPNSICELSSLETLDLHRCSKVSVLAMHVGDMESLKRLILDQTKIKTLPDSMRQLKKLTLLSLDGCRSLTELPEWTGSMESLRNLTLRGSTVERIPESIGHLTSLARLNAERSSIVALPHSIGNAKNLRRIYVDHTAIEEVPDSIGSLERLETLSLDGCNHIKFLPSSIGLLKNLAELSIGATLGCTGGIRELPESFGSLTALRRLYINRNAELLTVPSSFFQISSLEDLSARGCNWLEGVHGNDFSKLSSLKKLNLADSNFYTLPSLASFSFLKTLTLSFCERLLSIPQLPSSLQKLVAMGCSALETIIDISHLKALRVLKLNECTKVIDVHGLEKLRSLEELTLNDCSNLSRALRDRIKAAEFEYLSYFTISGTLGLHQGRHQVLSFVLPKMFRCNNPQLQITGDFKDRNCAAVHIEVMVDSLLLFEATREPNLQLDDYCICDFEEGDEMLTHVGNGYRIMHVWIDGFTMAGATIYMGNLESF